jgi:hypothetical protein
LSALPETAAPWLAYAVSEGLMLGATTAAVFLGLGRRLMVGFLREVGRDQEAERREDRGRGNPVLRAVSLYAPMIRNPLITLGRQWKRCESRRPGCQLLSHDRHSSHGFCMRGSGGTGR